VLHFYKLFSKNLNFEDDKCAIKPIYCRTEKQFQQFLGQESRKISSLGLITVEINVLSAWKRRFGFEQK